MFNITVSAAEAAVEKSEIITRGRVGLQCRFRFSPEWKGLAKTAVFSGAEDRDVIITGDTVTVPAECLSEANRPLWVGVCGKSGDGTVVIPTVYAQLGQIEPGASPSGKEPAAPTPDVVAQIQQAAANAEAMARSVRDDADLGRFAGPAGEAGGWYTPAVTQPDENTLRVAFTPSKEGMPDVEPTDIALPAGGGGGGSGSGADGKSAYAYAVEGGYTGTEEEFAAKLAQEKFANPYALTFTGAVEGSYDGSEAVTVEIPSGGGGGFEVLVDFTTEEAVTEFTIPKTVIGPLASKIQEASMLIMQIGVPRDTTDTSITTNGTISIKAYIGWLDDIAGGAFNCIVAPSDTYNSTYTKNVLFTKVPKSARTNGSQDCLVNIWGRKNNGNADAAVTRTVLNHLNSFYSDSYLTIVGSQTMAAGTRFMMGVIA